MRQNSKNLFDFKLFLGTLKNKTMDKSNENKQELVNNEPKSQSINMPKEEAIKSPVFIEFIRNRSNSFRRQGEDRNTSSIENSTSPSGSSRGTSQSESSRNSSTSSPRTTIIMNKYKSVKKIRDSVRSIKGQDECGSRIQKVGSIEVVSPSSESESNDEKMDETSNVKKCCNCIGSCAKSEKSYLGIDSELANKIGVVAIIGISIYLIYKYYNKQT